MTKINYTVGLGGVISSWTEIPFNEALPWIEIEDPRSIHVGFDKIENGVLVPDQAGYEAHMAEQEAIWQKKSRIMELKKLLADTDYQAIKHSEGLISEEDYAAIKVQRQAWRDEINELEAELSA
jgi:hypothetical protein